MPEVVNRAVIRAPAERIFALVEQAERNTEWVPDLSVSERLTPGPTARGDALPLRHPRPRRPHPHRQHGRGGGPGAGAPDPLHQRPAASPTPATGSWSPCPPAPDGTPQTRVTYAMSFELPPGLGPLVARMIDLPRRLDEQSQASLANLRRLLE